MNKQMEITRLDYLKLKLERGDKKKIAAQMGVHPEWVSRVLRGEGVSEPVIRAAEKLVKERETITKN